MGFKLIITVLLITGFSGSNFGQVNINTLGVAGMYTENFSGIVTTALVDNTAYTWNDNTDLLGWYISNETTQSYIYNSVLTTADNSGRNYIFNLSGDKSVGFRASGSSPNDNLFVGLRLRNNTGTAAASFYLMYYGEQWTIAENGIPPGPYALNNLAFSYSQASTVTSIISGTFTNASLLNFTQIHSCTLAACTGTSAQRVILNGNLSSNRTLVTGCVEVAIPDGQEIMLRWQDADNTSNDHHLQIDDIMVALYDVACAVVLPVNLLHFDATQNKKDGIVKVFWLTASESNLEKFIIERSSNGSEFEPLAEIIATNSTEQQAYEIFDPNPLTGVNYYRLKVIDQNRAVDYSPIRAVNAQEDMSQVFIYLMNDDQLAIEIEEEDKYNGVQILTLTGQIVLQKPIESTVNLVELTGLEPGIYLCSLVGKYGSHVQKIYVP